MSNTVEAGGVRIRDGYLSLKKAAQVDQRYDFQLRDERNGSGVETYGGTFSLNSPDREDNLEFVTSVDELLTAFQTLSVRQVLDVLQVIPDFDE